MGRWLHWTSGTQSLPPIEVSCRVAWNLLGDPLTGFFYDRRQIYAFIGLGLIVLQALFLDGVTRWLVNRLNLGRFE